MDKSTSSKTDLARVKRPERTQIEWRPMALDHVVPSDHRVRVVWRYIDSLDLSILYTNIQAIEGKPGRDAVDPKILMALWMFATIEGISSARQLARLCERDLAYMWICGGVGVNYHLLSDFRTAHGDFLDQLLTDTIATLMHQKLVTLEVVAQDGMRVRANAGSSSFRRKKTLERCRDEAHEQVKKLNEERENETNQDASNARRDGARKRAATEREQRVDQALEELAKLQAQREKRKTGSGEGARASTTDPEARTMKMACGGYRPAYNVQFATDGGARLIVGVEISNSGSDSNQMTSMHDTVRQRYGKAPDHYLVDCGFANVEDITHVEKGGSKVYAPIHGEASIRARGNDPHARKRRDSDESFGVRQRMATEEAKTIYKQRPSIAEYANAECRNRGLQQYRVRGIEKVRAVTLWQALTFNFTRLMSLGIIQ